MDVIVRDEHGEPAGYSCHEGYLDIGFEGQEYGFACNVLVNEEDLSEVELEFEEMGESGPGEELIFHGTLDPVTGLIAIPPDVDAFARRLLTEFNRDATPELLRWIQIRAEDIRAHLRQILAFTMPAERLVEGGRVAWGAVFKDEPAPAEETIHVSFELALGGTVYGLEDSWCLHPECECHEVLIRGCRQEGGEVPARGTVVFEALAHLDGQLAELVHSEVPEAEVRRVLEAWREREPDLEQTLTSRYHEMKEIGRRLHVKAGLRDEDEWPEDHWHGETAPARDVEDPPAGPPGRNDPCPCGSGRKYKKCCLPRDDTPLR
ncbi:MAG: SEC-C domain-containing protein [Planctomycetes bacterium]|jgi:hypothetical protein|nr:SEC-C domain-containing protein [Planctomycetota bacterium]